MKKWAFLTVGLYALAICAVYFLGALTLKDIHIADIGKAPFTWVIIVFAVVCQALLLIVKVDQSKGRPVGRRKFWTGIWVTALLASLLVGGVYWSLGAVGFGDKMLDGNAFWYSLGGIGILWLLWGGAFVKLYRARKQEGILEKHFRWLFRGSIL
jgi:hypothetical protein